MLAKGDVVVAKKSVYLLGKCIIEAGKKYTIDSIQEDSLTVVGSLVQVPSFIFDIPKEDEVVIPLDFSDLFQRLKEIKEEQAKAREGEKNVRIVLVSHDTKTKQEFLFESDIPVSTLDKVICTTRYGQRSGIATKVTIVKRSSLEDIARLYGAKLPLAKILCTYDKRSGEGELPF